MSFNVNLSEVPPGAAGVQLGASSFLEREKPWYAGRARRKKIALVRFEARNAGKSAVVLDLSRARLSVDGRRFERETRDAVISRLSTFQWDFLFYWILHFSLIELAIELAVFFAGAWFNRSLRKQLGSILDAEVTIGPGERLEGLVAFRGAARLERTELEAAWSMGGERVEWARCAVRTGISAGA